MAIAEVFENLKLELRRGCLTLAVLTQLRTERYGYTMDDEHAPPAKENAFIQKVFYRYYSSIPNIKVPLDSANFERFGASTTPTLVLVDRHGIVRLYHPGLMDEASLRAAAEALLIRDNS